MHPNRKKSRNDINPTVAKADELDLFFVKAAAVKNTSRMIAPHFNVWNIWNISAIISRRSRRNLRCLRKQICYLWHGGAGCRTQCRLDVEPPAATTPPQLLSFHVQRKSQGVSDFRFCRIQHVDELIPTLWDFHQNHNIAQMLSSASLQALFLCIDMLANFNACRWFHSINGRDGNFKLRHYRLIGSDQIRTLASIGSA